MIGEQGLTDGSGSKGALVTPSQKPLIVPQ